MRPSLDQTLLFLLAQALVAKAQSCPDIQIFGARETTVSPGFGSAGALIDMIKADHSGATAEAIEYPACGGQSSCGGVQYGDSARQGTEAVATAVNDFHSRCPDSQIVLVGYSQGGHIMHNAICGGGDSGAGISDTAVPITASAVAQVKAAILLGDPRYVSGLAYGVGTCTSGGFDARPSGFVCPNAGKVQLYCDAEDPYCCNGNDANHHQQYVTLYGTEALAFVNSKLAASGEAAPVQPSTSPDDSAGGSPSATILPKETTTGGNSEGGNGQEQGSGQEQGTNCAALWGQCGGQAWTGATCCSQGTCKQFNQYYSQCLN
ncbi:cutinase-domain-containing protein [Fusarium solani]|uniref:Cutinase-domain-containing protein n=1 Tax=Fusarium solani TaxID=169388 RepID=A0A9P9G2L0_FUSSL|nr:cutinase-domain-containing protein [Fusarium solani]KAH7232030.1 cutinase-domain-containing protein [Fusarium solani]